MMISPPPAAAVEADTEHSAVAQSRLEAATCAIAAADQQCATAGVVCASALIDARWRKILRSGGNLLPPLEKGRDGVGIATPSPPAPGRPPPFGGGWSGAARRQIVRPAG